MKQKMIKMIVILCIVSVIVLALFVCPMQNINNDKDMLSSTEATSINEPTAPTEVVEEIKEPTATPTDPPTEPPTEPPTDPPPTNFQITLSFAGDCTLSNVTDSKTSRGFMVYSEKYEPSYFLEKVKPIFEDDDFTVVNLECVLSDRYLSKRDKGSGRAFWFKGPTRHAEILTLGSVEGVSLANNHTFDYKNAGYEDTKGALTDAGLKYGYQSDIMYFEKNGFVIAVICNGLWYEEQADDIVRLIKIAEEQSNYQIVFYHGGTEKAHAPENWRIRASRKLVENGADLVLGNHPHVLQPIEMYNGAQIVYSLGNFCYGGHTKPHNRTMIYQMILTVNCESLEIEESEQNIIPCYVYTSEYNNYQPAPIENEEEIDRVIRFLNGELELPY